MSRDLRVYKGQDGSYYPCTSPDLVIDSTGESQSAKNNRLKDGIQDINTCIGDGDLTTVSKEIKGAINEVNHKVDEVNYKVDNVDKPTQEQVDTTIYQAIKEGKITGVNAEARALLQLILENAVFINDQSENISNLIKMLARGDKDV